MTLICMCTPWHLCTSPCQSHTQKRICFTRASYILQQNGCCKSHTYTFWTYYTIGLTMGEIFCVLVLTLLSVSTTASKVIAVPCTREGTSITVQSRPISKHCSSSMRMLSSGIWTRGPKKNTTRVSPSRVMFLPLVKSEGVCHNCI